MIYDDTIVAIATPPGVGGLGVIRLSGPQSLVILEHMFVATRAGRWQPYRMRFGRVVGENGATLDEALAVWMRAPHSFTAEDVVELSCHGGPLVLGQVLDRALQCGARQAGPGEFTMRAFLNGRIDLTQAEATLDVITARTEAGLALAQAQLGGWLQRELQRIRHLLLGPLAYCTVLVDFPEDEVDEQPVEAPLREALSALKRLRAGADQGIVYRQGARAVLVGRPNVGKSSLLNALLRVERAIVTPIPGTTRDTLEETASLGGVPFVLIDTAGITETDDPVERIGVERSRAALARADLALLVVDASAAPTAADAEIAASTLGRPTILVLNKSDLAAPAEAESVYTALRTAPVDAVVHTSAVAGNGLSLLAETSARIVLGGPARADAALVTNPRHGEALERALGHVADALDSYGSGVAPDLLAIDITSALSAVGEITGDDIDDDLLHTIFSTFCIGK